MARKPSILSWLGKSWIVSISVQQRHWIFIVFLCVKCAESRGKMHGAVVQMAFHSLRRNILTLESGLNSTDAKPPKTKSCRGWRQRRSDRPSATESIFYFGRVSLQITNTVSLVEDRLLKTSGKNERKALCVRRLPPSVVKRRPGVTGDASRKDLNVRPVLCPAGACTLKDPLFFPDSDFN